MTPGVGERSVDRAEFGNDPLILICPVTGDWLAAKSTGDTCPHLGCGCDPVFYWKHDVGNGPLSQIRRLESERDQYRAELANLLAATRRFTDGVGSGYRPGDRVDMALSAINRAAALLDREGDSQ